MEPRLPLVGLTAQCCLCYMPSLYALPINPMSLAHRVSSQKDSEMALWKRAFSSNNSWRAARAFKWSDELC